MFTYSTYQLTTDLSNCDREPIHIPGSIQPSGLLFVLSEPDLIIERVSENIATVLGITAEEVLQKPFAAIIGRDSEQRLQRQLQGSELDMINPFTFELSRTHLDVTPTSTTAQRNFWQAHAILHRYKDVLIAELEPAVRGGQRAANSYLYQTQAMLNKLQAADSVLALAELAAQEVQRLTNYDRVMVYRFDEHWHGEVIVEHSNAAFGDESYLGLHFPASDIPAQARALYAKNWVRLISEVNYEPAQILPVIATPETAPLDLSFATYRNVSPIHLEYLRNMGVAASFSITIMADEALWGLLVCHNAAPKFIPYNIRIMCEYLGQIISLQIPSREQHEKDMLRMQLDQQLSDLSQSIALATDCLMALNAHSELLLNLFAAQGAFIQIGQQYSCLGTVPEPVQILALANWCQTQMADAVWHSHQLATAYPASLEYQAIASGVLYIPLFPKRKEFILLFRAEIPQTVNWAGNPNKPVIEVGEMLQPRRSFALWQENIRGESSPWTWDVIRAAQKLQKTLCSKLKSLLIQFNTYHDSLTALPNQLLLVSALEERLAAQIQPTGLVVILLKVLSETTELDDMLLKQTAEHLQHILRIGDFSARLSWDEFVLVRRRAEGEDICQIETEITELLHSTDLPVKFHLGIAASPEDASTPEDLLKGAETAMQLRLLNK